MTSQQILAFGIVIGMMALFVWGRLRYDMVALCALLAAIVTGVVPKEKAFSGFSDDIVIIVASALVVSAAVARSGVVEYVMRWIGPYLTTTTTQVAVLSGAVMVLSGFVKNIGALAMLMPVAFQLARRTGTSPAHLLMPMAFASLLGGIVTLVGTSPNIIVSRVREEVVGEPFRMFDFTPVGVVVAALGLVFLAFGWRLLPGSRKGTASMDAAFNIEGYTTEVEVTEDSGAAGTTVGEIESGSEDEVEVVRIIRRNGRHLIPGGTTKLRRGDILLLEGEPDALEAAVARWKLKLTRDDRKQDPDVPEDDVGVMEGVVTGDSLLVGRSPIQANLYQRYGINLLAVSRSGARIKRRLRALKLQPGDVVVLQGNLNTMPEALGELNVLPLAERDLKLGRSRRSLLPILVLTAAMVLVALNMVPIAIAFFGTAVLLMLTRAISLRDAYEAIEWPILVMFGALIPVSDALHTTGATDVIAGGLSATAEMLPAIGTLALIMIAAMAVTPFLNNAATVLVMGPIAASFATKLGFNPDPFLMAVAIGAACDFLTPIGHQCNTLVMGAGGYRFGDYSRLGLPLSLLVVIVGTPLVALVWPLAN
jgi:di/tricarboxylate transporter